jgi:membrane protein YqaA with SNARE-associated domain
VAGYDLACQIKIISRNTHGTVMTYSIVESVVHSTLFIKYGLLGLFLNGLLSSIIPIPTELTTSALLLSGQSKTIVLIILIISSVVGGFIAYHVGYSGNNILKRLHKKPNKREEDRTHLLLERYGWVIIFFSPWIPIVGDFIPIIAGAKKYNYKIFIITMISGKAFKAIAIVFFSSWVLPLIFS